MAAILSRPQCDTHLIARWLEETMGYHFSYFGSSMLPRGIFCRQQRWAKSASSKYVCLKFQDKQRVLMHGHQGWNVRHGLCHINMIYGYIWVVYSFCLFCCLFIIVTTQFVALYKPCKPKPKPSTFDNIVLTIYPQYWYWKTLKDIL